MSLISFGCRVVVTALFFIGATPARAQVTNGDFNTGLEGWGLLSNGSSATFWSPHDAFFPFKLDSGSAAVTAVTTPAGPSAFAYFYTDAGLPPATSYVFGGIVSVDRTSAGGTDVRFGVNWMTPSSTCFNAIIRTDYGTPVPEGSRWSLNWTAVTPPAGATGACFFLSASNGHASFSVHLDKAFFVALP